MSSTLPSGVDNSDRFPRHSFPLNYQSLCDHEPKPFDLVFMVWRVWFAPQLVTLVAPMVVVVLDSLGTAAMELSRAEGPEASSKSSASYVDSVEEKKKWKIVASEEPKSYDYVRSDLTEDDLASLRVEYFILDQVTLRIPEECELPSSPPVDEVALNMLFFNYRLRLPFAPLCIGYSTVFD